MAPGAAIAGGAPSPLMRKGVLPGAVLDLDDCPLHSIPGPVCAGQLPIAQDLAWGLQLPDNPLSLPLYRQAGEGAIVKVQDGRTCYVELRRRLCVHMSMSRMSLGVASAVVTEGRVPCDGVSVAISRQLRCRVIETSDMPRCATRSEAQVLAASSGLLWGYVTAAGTALLRTGQGTRK